MRVLEVTRRETGRIACGVLGFSAVMELVFVLLRRWDLTVLWGNLLGGGWAVLNFFLLGLTVQKMADEPDPKRAKLKQQGSYSGRMLLTLGMIILAVQAPVFSWPAAVIPLLFPRLTILVMQMLGMYKPDKNTSQKGGDETV